MMAALALPRILTRIDDRTIMIAGGGLLLVTLATIGLVFGQLGPRTFWPVVLVGWLTMGIGYSLCVTPNGRLLKRSSADEDRPALFAAQFALSHVCWLVAYPLAGQIGARFGMAPTFLVLAGLAALGVGLALWLWPRNDPAKLLHSHPDLPSDHPHLEEHGGSSHQHHFVIDDLHTGWPGKV